MLPEYLVYDLYVTVRFQASRKVLQRSLRSLVSALPLRTNGPETVSCAQEIFVKLILQPWLLAQGLVPDLKLSDLDWT